MHNEPQAIVFNNLLDWAAASAFQSDSEADVDGTWQVQRGVFGSSSGTLLFNPPDQSTPELRFDPGLSGWHEVRVRMYHTGDRDRFGIYVGTTKHRALRILRPELAVAEFETLSRGPCDMSGASVRLDASYAECYLDSVEFVPCEPPRPLAPADKELCAIVDFADSPDDYRPNEHCAAECVRVHTEAGFTTLYWKAYKVVCEYHTKVGQVRPHWAEHRVSVGQLLETYDTLDAAVAEARQHDVKILAWLRPVNEILRTEPGPGRFMPDTPFHLAHPEVRQRERDGRMMPCLSFAFPEVRQYFCALGRELLDRGMDGLMIDVLRHPRMAAYDKPLVDAFIEQTGENPMEMDGDGTEQWLRFKATAFTDMLRNFCRMMDEAGYEDKELCVRTMPQLWRNLKVGCDVEAWMNQGLIDTLVIGHHMVRSPGHTVRYDLEPIAKLTRGRARLIVQVMRGCEMPVALELARKAYAHAAAGTAIYESNIEVTYPSKRDAFKRLRHTRL